MSTEADALLDEVAEREYKYGFVTDIEADTIELWTHAIGGLSENDFITAAKIDELPIKLKDT